MADIAERFGTYKSTVLRALERAARGPSVAPVQTPRAHREDAADGQERAAEGKADEDAGPGEPLSLDDQRRLLSEQMRSAAAAARTLRASGDLGAAAAQSRLVAAFGASLKRLTAPDPPPDPNERPDMQAAAHRGRAKLADYLERIRTGAL